MQAAGLPALHAHRFARATRCARGTVEFYSAALAGLAGAGAALTRRKRSTMRVPAWLGSRSTLASSFCAIAVTMRWPMPVERGSVLTLRPTPSSAIDSSRSSPLRVENDVDGTCAVRIGVFHRVHDQLVDDDADRHRAIGIDLDRFGLQRQPRHLVAFGGTPEILEQRFEVLIEQHAFQVVRGIEPPMHLRHRGDAAHGVGQRRLDAVLIAGIGLQMQQRGDDLQTVADAMVDLAQQHLAFGGKCCVAVARGVHLGLGIVAGFADHRLLQRAFDGDVEQGDEIAERVLHQIVGGARLQRGHRDPGVLRGGDEHHRRRARDFQDPRQRFQPVEAGHVLVKRDDVDAAFLQARKSGFAIGCMDDAKAEPRQATRDQPGERLVIVDIQQRGGGGGHGAACGT